MLPGFARKRHIFVEERMEQLERECSDFDINTIEYEDMDIGIITGGIAYHHEQHILYKARFILEQSIQAYAYQQEIPCAIGYYEVLAEGYPVIKGEMYCPHRHLPRLKQTEYYQIGRHIQRKPYLPVVGYPTFYCVHNAFFVRYSRCLHIALCLSLNDNAFRIISVIDIILPNRKKVYPML